MATLREMLVKIYQPRRGIIEFGPGQSTQDGNDTMSVLGGQPGTGGEGEGQGMGGVDVPVFRSAGLEGGGGGGGGLDPEGFDWSQFDPNDPQQFEMARAMFDREGGQSGEVSGVEFGDPNAYVDPTLAELTGVFGPGPLGLVGTLGAMGMRGHNVGLLDDELQGAGFGSGLSNAQILGAIMGMNDYGMGDPREAFGAQGIGGLAEAGYEAGLMGGVNDPALGVSANQRARSDTRGGASSFGGRNDPALGRSASARQPSQREIAESGQFAGGSSYGGGGSGSGGGGAGRGGFGDPSAGVSRDIDRGFGGGGYGFRQGGPVPATGEAMVHAGEHVMTPEAVDTFGHQTFERMNSLAKMMRKQHYPAR